MFWSKNKQLTSDEYDTLISKIKKLEGDVAGFKAILDAHETNMNSLRGLVNRKLSKSTHTEDDDAPPAKSGGVYIPEDELKALQEQLIAMGYQPK